jgi:hypothetical protein
MMSYCSSNYEDLLISSVIIQIILGLNIYSTAGTFEEYA